MLLSELMEDLRLRLEANGRYHHYREVLPRPPTAFDGPLPAEMSSSTVEAIGRLLQGNRPYEHQVEIWHALYKGDSVIVTTPTASGKTLGFAPVLTDRALRGGAASLLVYPLVDLGTSQANAFGVLVGSYRLSKPSLGHLRLSSLHSGAKATPMRERMQGRQSLVMTTPETLHRSLLPNNYPNWVDFFRRLRFVVLDEAHMYSGVFGSNMAFLLRRVVHRCLRNGGVVPQFVLCSATIRDPLGFAESLLPPQREPVRHIGTSGQASPGRREIAVLGSKKSLIGLFTDLLSSENRDATGMTRPTRVILFMKSRRRVVDFVREARGVLRAEGLGHLCPLFRMWPTRYLPPPPAAAGLT